MEPLPCMNYGYHHQIIAAVFNSLLLLLMSIWLMFFPERILYSYMYIYDYENPSRQEL